MASEASFVEYVTDQLALAGTVVAKKMFGEYGVYADGKLIGLICDNQFFVKPTVAGRAFIGEPKEVPAYAGAKNSFLIESELEDREWLARLIQTSWPELTYPKPRKSKKKS